jgi:thioredoxin 1
MLRRSIATLSVPVNCTTGARQEPDLRKDRHGRWHRHPHHVHVRRGRQVGSDEPVVVDFWAEWCGPCKMIAPILGEIADEQAGNITIAKLNVDENPDLAMRFNVMSIPTLLVFDKGQVAKRLVGAKGKGALLQELQEFLPPSH